jgi:hypothetical protein
MRVANATKRDFPADRAQSLQKVVAVAFEYRNARVMLVESLMRLEVGRGQSIIAILVCQGAADGALFEDPCGHIDLDGHLVTGRAGAAEQIKKSHRSWSRFDLR